MTIVPATTSPAMSAGSKRFNVYVIELEPAVLQPRRFRATNPQHTPTKACLDMGMGVVMGRYEPSTKRTLTG